MNSEQTELSKLLDDALRRYSDAEPRIGFESRIVANLRVVPAQPWWRGRIFTYVSAAIAVVCVMCYGVWRLGPILVDHRAEIASPQAVANRVPPPETVRSSSRASTTPVCECAERRRQIRRAEARDQNTIQESRLPVPMPLTQQEKLLLAFARENPEEVLSTVEWQERMREPAEQSTVSDRGEQQ